LDLVDNFANQTKMERWVLRMFRMAIVIGALAWAIGAGDLSDQARGFVDNTLGSWIQSSGR
jgi:hypothetical protein